MNNKKQLIVCLDGLGYDQISKGNTPFLYGLKQKSKLIELETLYAWTGIEFSFFSGQMPEKHNIWFEFIRKDNSLFKYVKPFGIFGRKMADYGAVAIQLLAGRTQLSKTYNIPFKLLDRFDTSATKNIWSLPFFKNKKYICYKWPFFVENGRTKLIFRHESDKERLKRLIDNLSDGIEIYYTQIVGLDKIIHQFSQHHWQTINKLKEIDKLAKEYYGKFLEYFPQGEVYYWSDHSFSDIKNYLDIQSIMPKSKDYLAFYGGTHISFWFDNKVIKNKIIKILSSIKEGYILTEEDRINQHIPLDTKHGQLIFAIKPNNFICPNYYQRSKNDFVSMHGYDTRLFDKNGILASNKKIEKRKVALNEAKRIIEELSYS